MRSSDRKFSMLGVLILLGMMTLSGCATKKWVRSEVGGSTTKLETRINETNTKVTETGERIDAVDRRAQQGIQAADQKATNAQRAADTANQALPQINTRITTVESRFNSIDTYTQSGSPQSVTFKNNSSVLSDEAKRTLDQIASQVSGKNSGFAIEIQGFTDDRGSENFNFVLSERRAESVKRYLVSKNIPLMRIAIVGLGEGNPVADNKTKTGRDQNRRVEIRLLTAAQGRTSN